MKKENNKSIDPFTGEEFIKKRDNQKFANRKNQTAYNNLKALKKRQLKNKIDKPLNNNRNILIKLVGDESEIIKSHDWLLALGYRFDILTHTSLIDKEIVACVYEFQVIPLGNKYYKIVRDENY